MVLLYCNAILCLSLKNVETVTAEMGNACICEERPDFVSFQLCEIINNPLSWEKRPSCFGLRFGQRCKYHTSRNPLTDVDRWQDCSW